MARMMRETHAAIMTITMTTVPATNSKDISINISVKAQRLKEPAKPGEM